MAETAKESATGPATASPRLPRIVTEAQGLAPDALLVEALARIEERLIAMQRRVDGMAASLDAVRRSQAVYLGDHVACTYLHNGWRIFVDTRSFDVGIHLIFGGAWETMHSRVFERMLFKGAGVLDVGANHGYYSVVAGPLVGTDGLLIAIEANPHLARLVHHSFSINGFLRFGEVHNIAVSDQPTGVVDLILNPTMSGGGLIQPAVSQLREASAAGDGRSRHRVGVTTIDALLGPERLGRIHVVKMDIEGAEGLAFTGMTGLLQRAKPLRILLEYNGHGPAVLQAFVALRPLLEAEGFEPLRVVHEAKLERMGWDELFGARIRQDIVVARKDDNGWISIV